MQPAVDISEDDSTYTLTVEAPGFEKDQITVEMQDDTICITGKAEEQREKTEKHNIYRERVDRSFQRAFRLPQDIDADTATANYKDGMLKIVLPKRQIGTNAKRLDIQ